MFEDTDISDDMFGEFRVVMTVFMIILLLSYCMYSMCYWVYSTTKTTVLPEGHTVFWWSMFFLEWEVHQIVLDYLYFLEKVVWTAYRCSVGNKYAEGDIMQGAINAAQALTVLCTSLQLVIFASIYKLTERPHSREHEETVSRAPCDITEKPVTSQEIIERLQAEINTLHGGVFV